MQSSFPISPPGDLAPVVAEVDRQLRGRLRAFQIRPDGEGIVLEGTAPSYYAKQLAQHAVLTEAHLPIVANEIEVC